MAGEAVGHRHRRALQRRGRAGAAHHHRDRVAQVLDAEVHRQLLGGREAGRRDDAVDVGGREPGVGDRGPGRVEHQLDGQALGAADVVGLADADDRRLPAERHLAIVTRTS